MYNEKSMAEKYDKLSAENNHTISAVYGKQQVCKARLSNDEINMCRWTLKKKLIGKQSNTIRECEKIKTKEQESIELDRILEGLK